MEKFSLPADHHNTTGEYNPLLHNYNGAVGVSLPGFLLPTDSKVLDTTVQLAEEFPFNIDYNSGDTIGVGWVQSTIANGERRNAAVSYLEPVLNRQNLDILVNTQVTKILKTGIDSGSPIFKGVQISQRSEGPFINLTANKEVILSAGAIKSPQILMLSGIGDATELSKQGIEVLVDLPDV